MSYASEFSTQIYAYLDPSNGEVKSLFVETPIGLTVRKDADWEVPDGQTEVNMLTQGYDCYKLNWDKNLEEVPVDVPDDYDDEHEAIYEFDKGQLNIGNILKYFDLAYKAGEGIARNED
jgi:hypothetical protein